MQSRTNSADTGETEAAPPSSGPTSDTGGSTTGDAQYLGQPRRRREDRPLITGEGEYTDDIHPPEAVHVSFVRSRYGHARIEGIDTSAAEAVDGVVTVLTGADLDAAEDVVNVLQPDEVLPNQKAPEQPLMPTDVARFTGDILAIVVAEDRYAASDGADAVDIEYDRLEAVVDAREALSADAPTIHEYAPDNRGLDWEFGSDAESVAETFEEAAHTVSVETHNQRLHPDAMEPRAVVAEYDEPTAELTVHMTTQAPYLDRGLLAGSLGLEAEDVQVVAPDVGGGFGSKCLPYPEQILVAWAAMAAGRPAKWVATRTESHVADHHGRDFYTSGEFALDDSGRVLAFRTEGIWNIGAYLVFATSPAPNFETLSSGAYAIPEVHGHLQGAFTNTSPVAPYRGAGRPEIIHLLERLMDEAAAELEMDPAEIRRRNYIRPDQFPYETPVSAVYDSGDYERTLDLALDHLDYESWRQRQRELRDDDRYLGIGIATFVENTGTGPGTPETGKVEIQDDGSVLAVTGTADHGQGHATAFSQLVADELGVTPEDVEVQASDTDLLPGGAGTFGSRSAAVGGSALAESARKVREEVIRLAARYLGVTVDEVDLSDGEIVAGGSIEFTLAEFVETIHTEGPDEALESDLTATTVFDPEAFEYSFGTHAAVVEVDPETGEIEFRQYVAVDDCGTQFNPMIVEGQVMGGVAQGIGQALYEHARYDENGTLTSGSLQDYALPKAMHVPDMVLDETETPSPRTPTGAKGAGEGGAIVAPPTVVNAVVDALRPLGVDSIEMPMTPETVWRAVAEDS